MSFKFLKYVAASLFLMAGFSVSTHAAEINQGAFSGNINTTVSSGFSMRVQERDCLMIDGLKYSEAETTDAAVIAGIISGRSASANLNTYVSGSGGGCAGVRTDDYGNTTNKYLDIYGNQTNNGNFNCHTGSLTKKKTSARGTVLFLTHRRHYSDSQPERCGRRRGFCSLVVTP